MPNETTPFTGKNFCKHANGEKKSKGKVEDGKRYELWNEWYENGEIKFETSFNDGQIKKRKNYPKTEQQVTNNLQNVSTPLTSPSYISLHTFPHASRCFE